MKISILPQRMTNQRSINDEQNLKSDNGCVSNQNRIRGWLRWWGLIFSSEAIVPCTDDDDEFYWFDDEFCFGYE